MKKTDETIIKDSEVEQTSEFDAVKASDAAIEAEEASDSTAVDEVTSIEADTDDSDGAESKQCDSEEELEDSDEDTDDSDEELEEEIEEDTDDSDEDTADSDEEHEEEASTEVVAKPVAKKRITRIKEFFKRHNILAKFAKFAFTVLIIYVVLITASFIVLHCAEKGLVEAYLETPGTAPSECGFTIDELSLENIDSVVVKYSAETQGKPMTVDETIEENFKIIGEEMGLGDSYSRDDIVDILSFIKREYEGVKEFFKHEDGTYYIGSDWLINVVSKYLIELSNTAYVLKAEPLIDFLYKEAIGEETYKVAESGLYDESFLELRDECADIVTSEDIRSKLNNLYDKIYRVVESGYNKLYSNLMMSKLDQLDEETRKAMVLPSCDYITYSMTYVNYPDDEANAKIDEAIKSKESAEKFVDLIAMINPIDDLYEAVEQNAYLGAFNDSKNKLSEFAVDYFTKNINKEFWFWQYIQEKIPADDNYLTNIESSLLNASLVVIPAFVKAPAEDKRCCWIAAQQAILSEIETIIFNGINTDSAEPVSEEDSAYYEDVATGALTLYTAYLQHSTIVDGCF